MRIIRILFLLLTVTQSAQATFIIKGNDSSSPFGFTQNITSHVYNPFSHSFYVGLGHQCGGAENTTVFSVSQATEPTFNTPNSFNGLVNSEDNALLNSPIEFMALSIKPLALPVVGTVVQLCSTTTAEPFTQNVVNALQQSSIASLSTDAINDAIGDAETAGIIDLAASSNYFFALVRPNNGNDFGDVGSGIALICINRNTSSLLSSIAVKNAQTGMAGNQAQTFNKNSVFLTGSTNPVVFQTQRLRDINSAFLFYDPVFERLYTAVRIETGTTAGDIALSVAIAYVNHLTNNSLTVLPIVASSAVNASNNQIVATKNSTGQEGVSAIKIGVMHTSTGPDYLIVNGGNGLALATGNQLYALPLVYNPVVPSLHGTLADKNSALINSKFLVPATIPTSLALVDDHAARIGAGVLPIESGQVIADLFVAGDTVYVALDTTPTSNNDTGTFYSQAQFDCNGKIFQWTPWKRATPFNAFPGIKLSCCGLHTGEISTIAVDASTGSSWIVEGNCRRLAGVTAWNNTTPAHGLVQAISETLPNGCFSSLVLDQATRGFLDSTVNRYALFGGDQGIVFTLISTAYNINSPSSAQQVTTNFSTPQNFFHTVAPRGGVTALEYSRRTAAEGAQNYFFAGTSQGLSVFADFFGNGFSVGALSTLDNPPFSTGRWQFISNIPGSIIALKSLGQILYVLAQTPAPGTFFPLISSLYSIPYQPTIATMFASSNIRTIAQSGDGIFPATASFFDFDIASTGPTAALGSKEQIVLATNQGLYISQADQIIGNGTIDALNQGQANWTVLSGTEKQLFFGIGSIDAPTRTTFFPWTLTDPFSFNSYDASTLYQLSISGATNGLSACFTTFAPQNFMSRVPLPTLQTVAPITAVWSDGTRRLLITTNPQNAPHRNNIVLLPFDSSTKPVPLSNPSIDSIDRFYWVNSIGATGLLMAGTEHGVIALE